MVLGGREQVCF